MVDRLAVPKQAAMALKLGAVARWRTVSITWRPWFEQDADGVEDDRDVMGQSPGGMIPRGIGRRGD
jgi:hypothetical protein